MFFNLNFKLIVFFIVQHVNFAKNESPSRQVIKKNQIEKINTNFDQKNSLLDATTAMFYHVENTKKCGNNLQIFNIDLKPFWNFKLKSQIKKTIRLANSVNLVLNNNDLNSQTQANGKTREDLETYLIESNFLSSLSYFIFSQSTKESLTPFKIEIEDKSYEERDTDETIYSKQTHNLINADPYIVGYGVVLYKNEKGSSKPKCLYIRKGHRNSIGSFQTNNSCESMNIKFIDSQYGRPFINDYENEESEDPPPDNHNCLNWSENLKSSYEDFMSKSSFSNKKDNLQSLNYDLFLEKLLHNKEFTHSSTSPLWCGPFYDCSAGGNFKDWIVMFTLPIFDKDKKIMGAVVVKLNITNMDVNQCEQGDPVFYNTHKCKPNSNCVFSPSNSFKSGNLWSKDCYFCI